MVSTVLVKVLSGQAHCKKDGAKYLVPESLTLSFYVASGDQNLVIDRVQEITVEDDVVISKTSRQETYAVMTSDITAVRMTSDKSGPGYNR